MRGTDAASFHLHLIFYVLGGTAASARFSCINELGGVKKGGFMVKRQRKGGGRGDGKFGARKKRIGRKRDCLTPLCFVRERECIVLLWTLSESPNSVNHC